MNPRDVDILIRLKVSERLLRLFQPVLQILSTGARWFSTDADVPENSGAASDIERGKVLFLSHNRVTASYQLQIDVVTSRPVWSHARFRRLAVETNSVFKGMFRH